MYLAILAQGSCDCVALSVQPVQCLTSVYFHPLAVASTLPTKGGGKLAGKPASAPEDGSTWVVAPPPPADAFYFPLEKALELEGLNQRGASEEESFRLLDDI